MSAAAPRLPLQIEDASRQAGDDVSYAAVSFFYNVHPRFQHLVTNYLYRHLQLEPLKWHDYVYFVNILTLFILYTALDVIC